MIMKANKKNLTLPSPSLTRMEMRFNIPPPSPFTKAFGTMVRKKDGLKDTSKWVNAT